jgi:hypothetical protein
MFGLHYGTWVIVELLHSLPKTARRGFHQCLLVRMIPLVCGGGEFHQLESYSSCVTTNEPQSGGGAAYKGRRLILLHMALYLASSTTTTDQISRRLCSQMSSWSKTPLNSENRLPHTMVGEIPNIALGCASPVPQE